MADEPVAALERLIDTWCDRRALGPLAIVLPAYTVLNGLTDGWADLLGALRSVRVSGGLPAAEAAAIERVEIAVSDALGFR